MRTYFGGAHEEASAALRQPFRDRPAALAASSPGERLEVPHDVSEIVDKHISALAGYAVGLALYMLQFKVQSE